MDENDRYKVFGHVGQRRFLKEIFKRYKNSKLKWSKLETIRRQSMRIRKRLNREPKKRKKTRFEFEHVRNRFSTCSVYERTCSGFGRNTWWIRTEHVLEKKFRRREKSQCIEQKGKDKHWICQIWMACHLKCPRFIKKQISNKLAKWKDRFELKRLVLDDWLVASSLIASGRSSSCLSTELWKRSWSTGGLEWGRKTGYCPLYESLKPRPERWWSSEMGQLDNRIGHKESELVNGYVKPPLKYQIFKTVNLSGREFLEYSNS